MAIPPETFEPCTRILFLWDTVSGYMTACWRALANIPDVELRIVARRATSGDFVAFPEAPDGVDLQLFDADELRDVRSLAPVLADFRPRLTVVSGWRYPAYLRALRHAALSSSRIVLAMDNPLRRDWRQRLARLKIGRLLNQVDHVLVPGERSWQLARYWKVPECKVRRGLYGVDTETLAPLFERRRSDGWPRNFLYVGIYHRRKGLDVLLEGYRRYRRGSAEPWPLTCCGMGPLAAEVAATDGVSDEGFVQPSEMGKIWQKSGALMLCSRYDAWGMVILEACAAGLPVVCTAACGSAVELVRPGYNGLILPTGDAGAIARALAWIEARHGFLEEMGRRARAFAAPYDAGLWAERISSLALPGRGAPC